ncbi:P-type DNA transfer ATPase VirB11 [Novosphingobium sp. SG720]|uniref:P-type DNA transfer ATPase VirB11 n=1 Tax=Novosphingobium sp. SG720 TaxID=2586998 RepID=UPI0018538426|nr:type IV secretion system protein VirB11 [Novosphingobium sp. SG720]
MIADPVLAAALAPLLPFLARPDVCEVMVNRPGQVWVEAAGAPQMECHDVPALDERALRRLAEQVARISHQGVNRAQPLLGATLPDGARIQFVGPPATRTGWAMAIRRHRVVDLPLSAWAPQGPLALPPLPETDGMAEDPLGWLAQAVAARSTVLIAGGTSSGKTTFLNALLAQVPRGDRVLAVEDTPEIRLAQPNALGLVAVRGELGEAQVDTDALLRAALRLRPDRIVLGELRGAEAITFLRAINTGHPGSFTTIHANSCTGALEQLALLVMQAGLGLARRETLHYAAQVIDVVVHLGRQDGRRAITGMALARDLVAGMA